MCNVSIFFFAGMGEGRGEGEGGSVQIQIATCNVVFKFARKGVFTVEVLAWQLR